MPSLVNESDCEQDHELAKSTSVVSDETDTNITEPSPVGEVVPTTNEVPVTQPSPLSIGHLPDCTQLQAHNSPGHNQIVSPTAIEVSAVLGNATAPTDLRQSSDSGCMSGESTGYMHEFELSGIASASTAMPLPASPNPDTSTHNYNNNYADVYT